MADLENLVKVVNTGLDIPDFTDIRDALITKYKAVFGSDIDLSSGTADGIFVYDIALLINNLCQALEAMYSNLDVNAASGKYLDTICELGNIHRKGATKSNTYLTLTVPTSSTFPVTFTASEVTFVDKSGKTWHATSDFTFEDAQHNSISVYVECDESGPIAATNSWIYQTLAQHSPAISVSQAIAAKRGSGIETDSELRLRRALSNSSAGTAVEQSLVGALLDIPSIRDIKTYVNYSDAAITTTSGISVPAHDMYILLRIADGMTVTDETIGKLISHKLTPGVKTINSNTTGVSHSYTFRPTQYSAIYSEAKWDECAGVHPACSVELTVTSDYATTTNATVANALINYCNSLKFNQAHAAVNLRYVASQADPKYNNAATFIVSNASWTIAEFPDDFCDYNSYSVTTSGSTVTISLTKTTAATIVGENLLCSENTIANG